jgi:CTP:molybdopterin cytidylyltransferase MocA
LKRIAAIVLAAGAATRMGRPKQLLNLAGTTLLAHAAQQAFAADFSPVVVVLGAYAGQVRTSLAAVPVTIVENTAWESGMGSSIAAGMRALPDCDAVAVLLADQPLVTAAHLRQMRGSFQGDIIAARYNDRLGVPAIFPKRLFDTLAKLHGDEGARNILRSPGEQVIAFDLPEAALDIDTPGDWAALSAT